MNDAAFGPRALSSGADPVVAEGQRLLRQLGYDPGEVNGIFTTKTRNALNALWMAWGRPQASLPLGIDEGLLSELREAAQRAGVQAQQGVQAIAPPAPTSLVDKTKKPVSLVTGLSIVVGAGLLWLALRKDEEVVLVGEGSVPDPALGDAKPKRKRKAKPLSDLLNDEGDDSRVVEGEVVRAEKCSRTPNTFDAGEPLTLPAETTTAPSV